MKIYFTIAGGHVHCRVFMNGGKCGDLCFRADEFHYFRAQSQWMQFIDETKP